MARKRFIAASASLVLAMSLTFATPTFAFAPVKLVPVRSFFDLVPKMAFAPKKVVPLALSHPKAYALKLLKAKGIASQYGCLVELWKRESHWNYKAHNPYSTAYGIWQGLIETSHDPAVQIRNGLRYIGYRYSGSPCLALSHSSRLGWY